MEWLWLNGTVIICVWFSTFYKLYNMGFINLIISTMIIERMTLVLRL